MHSALKFKLNYALQCSTDGNEHVSPADFTAEDVMAPVGIFFFCGFFSKRACELQYAGSLKGVDSIAAWKGENVIHL